MDSDDFACAYRVGLMLILSGDFQRMRKQLSMCLMLGGDLEQGGVAGGFARVADG